MAVPTVAEIKKTMTDNFIANENVIVKYGLEAGKTFEEQFSVVSVESITFYIVAFCAWTLRNVFEDHKAEITAIIETKKPHRPKWYVDKGLAFRFGRALVQDEDYYDLTGIDVASIAGELVVKFCDAVEYQGKLFIKVAGGTATNKTKLSDDVIAALTAYFEEIKDDGVQIVIVNLDADHFACKMDIYYNPMILKADGTRISDGVDIVRDTIKSFVQNGIPFNGIYRNDQFVDELQNIAGVEIPNLLEVTTIAAANIDTGEWISIPAKHIPESGYFKVYADEDLTLNFIAYQIAND